MSSWPSWYFPVAVVLGVLAAALFGIYWAFDALADRVEKHGPSGHH